MDIVSHFINFNSQTAGRDKLFRVFQYSSKFVYWQLLKAGKNKVLVEKLKLLESQLSTTRKVLRLGKSMDMLKGAWQSSHLADTILRHTLTLAKLHQSAYLLIDNLVWLGKVGLVDADVKRWVQLSARFWLIAIIFNIMRNIYDIHGIIYQEKCRRSNRQLRRQYCGNEGIVQMYKESHCDTIGRLVEEHVPVAIDTVKNVADLILPLSTLGYIGASPGTQGLAGMLSSVLGIVVLWNPRLKLLPA